MASRCQRSILSCSRCRRRKLKCDRQLPSCSQCLAAATTCSGIAAGSETEVPRSIVHHLESEIARLEAALLESGQLEDVQASDILMQIPASNPVAGADNRGQVRDPLQLPLAAETQPGPSQCTIEVDKSLEIREIVLSSTPLRSLVLATVPPDSGATELLSRVRMGMTPSAARISDRSGSLSAGSPKSATGGSMLLGANLLRSMPVDIMQKLMTKYLDTIHPENPFLIVADLHAHFARVVQDLTSPVTSHVAASYHLLVVYLILATSLTLAAVGGRHEERCMAFSMSVFKEGIQNLYGLSSFPSEIARLQVTLLILHYATVFPRLANVWVLSGAAMRSCLELGLHRELPASTGPVDPQTLDLRRRVFWTAYCMDRSICSALQRPVSIPDVAIDAKLPLALAAEDNTDPFLGSISYHRLLSEMLHVHYQGEPIPSDLSWDDWLANMESRLQDWYNMYSANASHHAMTEFNMARGLMILHRPSPGHPMPSPSSLLVAFQAASTVARTYREHMRARLFCRPWLSAHFTLEAATIVLFCLRHGTPAIVERFTPAQIFKMTKTFTGNFLDIAAQGGGWPEINAYASVYERLLGPLLERVFLRSSSLSDAFGPAQDTELLRLLYPGPAQLEKLRFGGGPPEASVDLESFDFNLFMADDNFWGTPVDMLGET